ncbi:MAG TPA: BTAD domain-containing putative transcriptional regulator [Thermopolyspora sp.]
MLGPLTVISDGEEVPFGGSKLRVALAGLLLRAGETVPVTRLAGWLWNGEVDDADRAKATVQSYINRLRRHPGMRDIIRTVPEGYRAELGESALDLLRFRSLTRSARHAAAAGDLESASRVLAEAMALWHGPILPDVDSVTLHRDEVEPLIEEWLRVQEQWLDVGLRTGRHAELIPGLWDLTRAYPLREPFWEGLMLALYRSGRHAEALRAYHTLSEILADELGVDPSPSLRATHQAILTGDPSLAPPQSPEQAPYGRPGDPVPRQLRPDIPGFVGRRAELAALDRLLDEATSPTPTIISVQGTAGSGKTALAIHWAHLVRDRFPDGQLYLDLRGYGHGQPVRPATALEIMLRGLGMPAERIPVGIDERSALFRTLLAGRRLLVLLDNAANSEQIRPLVPGSDGMVLVTSRNQLRGLIVQYGARRVILDQMTAAEGGELLAEVVGHDRVAADPEAATEVVRRCARLPLALRIFAERAARFPATPLRRLAEDLRDERLAALDTGDGDETDLRKVFSWTYRALDPPSARLFRLLGLHPGPEISTGAAAALIGGGTALATRLLDRLTADHMLRSRSPGRYDFHDLLRDYAVECARDDARQEDARDDPEGGNDAALRRVLDWYLHSAWDAAEHLPPGGRVISVGPVPPGITPLDFDDPEGSVGWYEMELPNLMAATRYAASRGWYGYAWRLPGVLASFFDFHVPGTDWVDLYRMAAEAARHEGERDEEGRALNHLAWAYTRLGRLEEAITRYHEALAVARLIDDRDLEGGVLVNLGTAYFRLGRYDESTRCHGEALVIARDSGDGRLEAETLSHLARNDTELGRHAEALDGGAAALRGYAELDDRYRQGEVLRTMGMAHLGLKRYEDAADAYGRALVLMREFEDRRGEADVLDRLGGALLAAGRVAEARRCWREAVTIFMELNDARAATLRERLAEIGPLKADLRQG